MIQYLDAVREVLAKGTRKENRTGVDTLSTFAINYKIDLREGFPLLTTKKINWKNIVVENLWFLSGEPHIGLLKKHNCKFWDAWADEEGMVPSAYGNFWRRFPVDTRRGDSHYMTFESDASSLGWNDQVAWVVDQLRINPTSRRLVISAWAPNNAQTSMLPPCHIVMVFNVQNWEVPCECPNGSHGTHVVPHLCLHLTQRSCDIALGVPYNIAGYAFLLELFARFANMPAGIFAHTLVDAHAYTSKPDGSKAEWDHIPGLKEQLTRDPRLLPRLVIDPSITSLDDIGPLLQLDTGDLMPKFVLDGYDPHPAIKFKVAV